jgi:hypothetical protein
MPTGDVVPINCNANGYCSFRVYGGTGWACVYTGYCDYQLPRDSRTQFGNDFNNEDKKK